jgi:hypothetical protein
VIPFHFPCFHAKQQQQQQQQQQHHTTREEQNMPQSVRNPRWLVVLGALDDCQFASSWLLFVVHGSQKMKEFLMSFLDAPQRGILNKWVRPYQEKKVAFYGAQPRCLTSLGWTQ